MPAYMPRCLQSVLNAAARIGLPRSAHITRWFTLASGANANAVQTVDPDIQLPPFSTAPLHKSLLFIVSLMFLPVVAYVLIVRPTEVTGQPITTAYLLASTWQVQAYEFTYYRLR